MTTQMATMVRVARPDEHGAVRDLLRIAYEPYETDFPPEAFGPYMADLLDVDGDGRTTTLVTLEGDRIVGTARYYPPGVFRLVPGDWAWIGRGAVLPEARRTGVAMAMMAEGLRMAREDRAAALSLHTTQFMPATIQMCDRLGFRRAPEYDADAGDYFSVDARMQVIAFRKDLGPWGAAR